MNSELMQYSLVGAQLGKIEAIAVTNSSVAIDLSARTNIYADLQAGRVLVACPDAVVWYAFSSESGGTIDNTSTAAHSATACAALEANVNTPLLVPMVDQQEVNSSAGALTVTGMCRYLIVKTATSAILRLWVATETPRKRNA